MEGEDGESKQADESAGFMLYVDAGTEVPISFALYLLLGDPLTSDKYYENELISLRIIYPENFLFHSTSKQPRLPP